MVLGFLQSIYLRFAFLIALHGAALLTLGTVLLAHRSVVTTKVRARPWEWLGAWALLKGAGVLTPLIWAAVDRTLSSEASRTLYLAFATPAWAALLEFVRRFRGLPARHWTTFAAPLIVVSTAVWLLVGKTDDAIAYYAWIAAAPAGIAAAIALGREREGSREFAVMAAAIGALALAELLPPAHYLDRFQGFTASTVNFYLDPDYGSMLGTMVCAIAAFAGWWRWVRRVNAADEARRDGAPWVLPASVVAVVACGFGMMRWSNESALRVQRAHHFAQLRAAARLLPDPGAPLKGLIIGLHRARTIEPDWEALFVAETGADGSLRVWAAAPTSAILPERPRRSDRPGAPMDERFFAAREAFSSQPMGDERGAFVLNSVPLNGSAAARRWLIARVEFGRWTAAKADTMVQSLVITVLFGATWILYIAFHQYRGRERELRAVAAARGEMVAAVNHELRAPVQNLLNYAGQLRLTRLDVVQERCLDLIQGEIERGRLTIEGFLNVLTADSGRPGFQPEPVSIEAVLETCIEEAGPAAEEKDLRLELSVHPELRRQRWFQADPIRLRQILGNVIGNAVKFTPQGQVRLSAHPAEKGGVMFIIEDTGPGIAADMQAQLFQPFVRGPTKEPGTGLGLALVRRLCTALGGQVTLASEPGRGTTVTIFLPLSASAPPAELAAPRESGAEPAPRLELLVVDDRPAMRESLAGLVRMFGHGVELAVSGEAALAACRARRFDMVLLDFQLTGMDGPETARRLLAEAGPRTKPRIIGLTAENDPAEHARGLAAGMEAILTKPMPPAVFARLIPPAAGVAPDPASAGVAEFFDEARRTELRREFVVRLPGLMTALQVAVRDGEWAAVKTLAHGLRNDALALGMPELAGACARLEAAETHTPEAAEAARRRLEAMLLYANRILPNPSNRPMTPGAASS